MGFAQVSKSLKETCSQFAGKAKSLEIKYFSETWRQEAAAALLNICSSSHIFIKMKRFSRDTLCVRSILSHKALTWKKKKQILHSNTFIVFFDIDSFGEQVEVIDLERFCLPASSVCKIEDQVSWTQLQFCFVICISICMSICICIFSNIFAKELCLKLNSTRPTDNTTSI